MSVEIWPRIAPEQLEIATETSQKRELDWLLEELHATLKDLKHHLEECYALLAPVDPGSTLVLSTRNNEAVKGTVTRVGTRIVKGAIHLRLRTLPAQTLTINPDHPIHLAPLVGLHSLLTDSVDVLGLTLSYCYPTDIPSPPSFDPAVSSPHFISTQLRLLSQHLAEASSLLRGPPRDSSDPAWTTRSASPTHFRPSLPGPPPQISFYLGVQDGELVLWLRSLEPADAPVALGTKLALAIGTARRLEHDEAERVFGFCCGAHADEGAALDKGGGDGGPLRRSGTGIGSNIATWKPAPVSAERKTVDVYVREKVKVESADPSLMSLKSKLLSLGNMLDMARRNLAAVMGEELED